MKKFLLLFAVVAMFTACNENVEMKAKEYAVNISKAFDEGDLNKVRTLNIEMEEWMKQLSEEDKEKAIDIIYGGIL